MHLHTLYLKRVSRSSISTKNSPRETKSSTPPISSNPLLGRRYRPKLRRWNRKTIYSFTCSRPQENERNTEIDPGHSLLRPKHTSYFSINISRSESRCFFNLSTSIFKPAFSACKRAVSVQEMESWDSASRARVCQSEMLVL